MIRSSHIKNLRKKRTHKVNKISEYFEKHYPNIKLKYQMGNVIKIKYKDRIVESFNSTDVIGNRREYIFRNTDILLLIILRRFNSNYPIQINTSIVIPKYYYRIRNVERGLIKIGVLRISPKLKRVN